MPLFEFKCSNCGTTTKRCVASYAIVELECLDCGFKAVRTDQIVFKYQQKEDLK